MAKTALSQLKAWFSKGLYPTQEQFWAWMDSFYHKDDTIPMSNIDSLTDTLNSKAESAVVYTKTDADNLLSLKEDARNKVTEITDTNKTSTTFYPSNAAVTAQLNLKADLENGKVPATQLPSYVDDVVEGYYSNSVFYSDSALTTAITGESGKIYVDLATNYSYRYSGSYIRIDQVDLATESTAGLQSAADKTKTDALDATIATDSDFVSGTDNSKRATVLGIFTAFKYWLQNVSFSELLTTSKNLIGAVNELFNSKTNIAGNVVFYSNTQNIGDITNDSKTFTLLNNIVTGDNVAFGLNADATHMYVGKYISSSNTLSIVRYSTNTPTDITTYIQDILITGYGSELTNSIVGLRISPDEKKMYILTSNKLLEYNMTVMSNAVTVSYTGNSISITYTYIHGFDISPDGKTIYLPYDNAINIVTLATAWSLSTVTRCNMSVTRMYPYLVSATVGGVYVMGRKVTGGINYLVQYSTDVHSTISDTSDSNCFVNMIPLFESDGGLTTSQQDMVINPITKKLLYLYSTGVLKQYSAPVSPWNGVPRIDSTGQIYTAYNYTPANDTAVAHVTSGVNSDITSLTGLTTALSLAQGGTGATTASAARANLGTAASGANSDITSLTGISGNISFISSDVSIVGSNTNPALSMYAHRIFGDNTSLQLGVNDVIKLQLNTANQLTPVADNSLTFGGASNAIKNIYSYSLTFGATITPVGTTGAQTINKSAGRVNVAAGATSIVVTNSLVTANSIITAVAATNDATCVVKSVVAAAGSFTINVVAPTAETAINFIIIN